jgi:hypothetical protein
MNKKFKKIKFTGWCLFILLMIPFILVLIAEPLQYGDEPQMTWTMGFIVYTWLGSLSFSALLIVIGKYNKKQESN